MEHHRYPHMVFKGGVAHLEHGHNEDHRIVHDEAEERAAAAEGYVSAADPMKVETPKRGRKASDAPAGDE